MAPSLVRRQHRLFKFHLFRILRTCLEARHSIKIGTHFSSVFKIAVYAAAALLPPTSIGLLTHVTVLGWVLGARNTKLVHVSFLIE